MGKDTGWYYWKKKRKLTKSQKLAWLAGFMDGEGSFMLMRTKRTKKRNLYVWACITIPSTDRFVLEEVEKILKFSINVKSSLITERRRRPNCKQVYVLRISNIRNTYHLCRVLVPFLVLKKERAGLMLEYLTSRLSRGGTLYRPVKKFGNFPYSERETFIIDEIKRLNRRGYHPDV